MQITERIVQVAILDGNNPNVMYTMPAPNRHHHVFSQMNRDKVAHGEQGFLTSEGRFVSRYMAYKIAARNGQLKRQHSPNSYNGNELYSEDLW